MSQTPENLAPKADINVGTGKLTRKPRGKPFQAGNAFGFKRGNSGRPLGARDKALQLSEAYAQELQELVDGGQMTAAEAIVKRVVGIAISGKSNQAIVAAKEAFDRAVGKPAQSITVTQAIDSHTAARLLDIAQMLKTKEIPMLEAEIVESKE
jgi:hypothetical protein